MTAVVITTSVAKRFSESAYSEKPALLNAATEWNTPCQKASSQA